MTIKDDLTSKDVLDRFERIFERMDTNYKELVKDINVALGTINETNQELQKARTLYEKGLTGAMIASINKHPKLSLVLLVVFIFGFFGTMVCIFKDKDLSYKDREHQVEVKKP